ncbi:type VII secretion protein EccCa [Natronosporangium hydrolyticum]|uniref:Type VII secretion protein EccCa n=1 Tax=Natronosporangium hydrolyticum TaxID=2811111 RepID=A0A895YJM3_9ACTN|nr:type VII secretion protein EccCa [Natronosporangium hydrolyticum]QSB15719.1 type VII secretion protein EccCa [Natronosporangium hydrolyticum]
MSTVLVKRPARINPPAVDSGDITIADPPKPQQSPPAAMSASMIIMPVMAGGGGLMMALNSQNPLMAAAGGLFLVAAVSVGIIMLIAQRSGPRRQLREARERYLDYLEELRRTLRKTVSAQQASSDWRHPEPAQLLDVARTNSRRWERRVDDDDFLVLRMGLGDRPVATQPSMNADDGPLNEFDPVCLETAKTLRNRYATIREQPICLNLAKTGVLSVVGDRHAGRELAKALIAQLVTFHAPQEVRLAVVRAHQQAPEWEWAKWLPHHHHASKLDGELSARLVATSVSAMAELIGSDLEARQEAYQRQRGQRLRPREQLVIVVDGEHLQGVYGLEPPERGVSLAELGVHVILLLGHRREEPEAVDGRISVVDGSARQEWDGTTFRVDALPDGLVSGLARMLAPLRLVSDEGGSDLLTGTVGLPDILGVADVARLAPEETWQPRALRERLRVPIGVGTGGNSVMLDLKESAHGGMGPHGLVVGATGSGKSEMLRTLLTSLVIGHPPDLLALMLVDFKGGASFAPMAGLPHIAGMVTNIEDDITLVDRMHDALFGEMRRRQEVLKSAGNLPNVSAYHTMRASGQPLEPLPHLLVVIDEFSELLTAKPDFAELFVAIGRIGRSIGVHLLLATQRLEMGKIRGLESHLSYRISLRTFSEGESREAIGVPDAYHLPPEPGSGYLKVDTTVFERFKAALVSAPYTPPQAETKTVVPVVPYLSVNGLGGWLATQSQAAGPNGDGNPAPADGKGGQRSILDVAVERLAGAGAPAVRPVWLAPLPEVLPLDLVQDPQARGGADSVSATLGLADDPSGQRQFPFEWDFTGAGGNLVVLGAPQSGKSTVLRTMLASMALRYAPGEVACYCIDYGGGGLVPLAELPVVAGVATRLDPERVSRTISEVANAVNTREALFREYGLASPAALRAARATGTVPAEIPGAVFLIIDGWAVFREEFELLEDRISEIAARGANYGVHVVISITQAMQIRMRMQPSFTGRVELRLSDAFDTMFDRELQKRISKETPGRGVIEGDLLFQAAVPRIDGRAETAGLADAQAELITTAAQRWPQGRVATVQVLPHTYPYEELPPAEPGDRGFPVGISDLNLKPAGIDLFGADPHLVIYGDGETGKTNLLRVILSGARQLYTPEQLGVVLIDYRRSLLGVVPDEYLLAYSASPDQTAAVTQEIAQAIAKRRPGPDVTPAQLKDRSWWTGLEILFVVDDYDLVATGSGNPLTPLTDLLAQARDLGLHLVLSRRTGGAARSALDPVVQRLGDVSAPGFLFSGDRMEGPLANGVTSQRLPAGRALYAMRGGGFQQVQVAWLPPEV